MTSPSTSRAVANAGELDSSLWHSVVLCESATIIRSVTIHDIS